MKILALVVVFTCSSVFGAGFESTAGIDADDVIPTSLLLGPNHKVSDSILNNGMQNTYTVESQYGDFEAQGSIGLRIRIRQVDALTYLDNLSKSAVFIQALADAGISSVLAVANAITKPVATIKGLPAGIGRLFTGYIEDTKRGVEISKGFLAGSQTEGLDPAELKKLNYLLGDAEREWAAELKVDPYGTNMVLRTAISNMAVVQFIGSLPVDFALPRYGGLAVGVLEEIGDKIYGQDAKSLEEANRVCLNLAGIKESELDAFFATGYMTPTMHAMYCSAANRLTEVENVSLFVDRLIQSQSFEESRFLLSTMSLMAWHHNKKGPLAAFMSDAGLPFAKTEDGHLLVMVPGDYLVWTEAVALRLDQLSEIVGDDASFKGKSIWLLGAASNRASRELASRNWNLHDRSTNAEIESVFQSGLAAIENAE
ncbi:MAG: hypothetical protein ACJAVI_005051 [Candidatus Azotimanducaceae bacterium]|jgi:hypothetical protein